MDSVYVLQIYPEVEFQIIAVKFIAMPGASPCGYALNLDMSTALPYNLVGSPGRGARKTRTRQYSNSMDIINPLYTTSGFAVGLLVGMTGVGGGSLMTPVLILLFGIHPATAVGTDLLYAAATKTGGSLVHGLARNIDWRIVGRLACGSIPASLLTLVVLWRLELNSEMTRSVINLVLSFSLFLTAASLVFRRTIRARFRNRFQNFGAERTALATVAMGAALGVLVSLSSVGAGAVGVMGLLLLYPELPMATIIGSDIAHAVPLTLVAGTGHWLVGSVDWRLLGSLLVGSLPGIFIGSYFANRVPERALRAVLAVTLLLVASKLAVDEWNAPSSVVTAFTRRAAPIDAGATRILPP
jgi:uncharacterized membrane protein YfcA